MASTSNVIESAPLVKQSKKHAETLNRAREADITTCIGEGTRAKLEVRRPTKVSLDIYAANIGATVMRKARQQQPLLWVISFMLGVVCRLPS